MHESSPPPRGGDGDGGAAVRRMRTLEALVESCLRVHGGRTVDAALQLVAEEARRLFDARSASAEAFASPGHQAVISVARADAPSTACGPDDAGTLVTRDLVGARGQLLGRLTLRGVDVDAALSDATVLQTFARAAASCLESVAWLRVATEATKARDDVLAILAHDLRSPLGTVSLGARMLRDSLRSEGTPRADDVAVVERMARACEGMESLVAELLDVARMDAGSFAVILAPAAVADVLAGALDAATMTARAAGITVRLGAVPDVRVMADRARLREVFANLVGNALRFTPGGGDIELSACCDGSDVLFTVTDSGSGIPPGDLPRLFDRYWSGAEGPPGGLGLGLYIARGIVEAHRGRIAVASDAGRGTTFTFTLPRAV